MQITPASARRLVTVFALALMLGTAACTNAPATTPASHPMATNAAAHDTGGNPARVAPTDAGRAGSQ